MRIKQRLGEILVKQGVLTEEMLAKILNDQKKTNLKIGQFLIRQGILQEKQIIDLLCEQLNLQKYQINKFPLDLESGALYSD